MKKLLALLLSAAMVLAFGVTAFAGPAVDIAKISLSIKDGDGNTVAGIGTQENPFEVNGNKSYSVKYDGTYTDQYGNSFNALDGATVETELVSTVFATMGSHNKVERSFPITFTNSAFDSRTVRVNMTFSKDGAATITNTIYFKVAGRTSENIFSESNAINKFREGDVANLTSTIEQITEGAFSIMLDNSSRSIVLKGNDYILTFDKNSQNLAQDVEVRGDTSISDEIKALNSKATLAAINLPISSATAKIEIAVGASFSDKFDGKQLTVYTKNGTKTNIEATLKGNTVSFTAPLASYIVTGDSYNAVNGDTNSGSSSNSSTGNVTKPNPNTGSSSLIGAASAAAILTLVAAGAVALKKSK